jgi:hypothetical protein
MGPGFTVADVMDKGGHNSDVSQVTERPGPPPASNPQEPPRCRWCGQPHGPLCPYVKALEFDQGNSITRVEFLTPADYQRPPPADTVADEYPKKPGG